MCNGFGKGEILLFESSENAKFDSIRTKIRQEVLRVGQQKWSKGPAKMKITCQYTKLSLAILNTALHWRNTGNCEQTLEEHIPITWDCWLSDVSALAMLEQTLNCQCWLHRGVHWSLQERG